jgi:hypothetical protein
MNLRLVFSALLAVLALSGCQDGGRSETEAAEGAKAAAKFRYVARNIYEALFTEACQPTPALRRALLLANEHAAMRAFEEQVRSGPPGVHLAIAKTDVGFEIERSRSCSDDSATDFAKMHIDRAREVVRAGISELQEMAPSLPAVRSEEANLAPAKGAEFRSLVRSLVFSLNFPCQLTPSVSATNEARLSRQRFEQTPFAFHFDVAEADTLHDLGTTIYECSPVGSGDSAEDGRAVLDEVRVQIARIEASTRR